MAENDQTLNEENRGKFGAEIINDFVPGFGAEYPGLGYPGAGVTPGYGGVFPGAGVTPGYGGVFPGAGVMPGYGGVFPGAGVTGLVDHDTVPARQDGSHEDNDEETRKAISKKFNLGGIDGGFEAYGGFDGHLGAFGTQIGAGFGGHTGGHSGLGAHMGPHGTGLGGHLGGHTGLGGHLDVHGGPLDIHLKGHTGLEGHLAGHAKLPMTSMTQHTAVYPETFGAPVPMVGPFGMCYGIPFYGGF